MPTEMLLALYKETGKQEYKGPLVLRYVGLVKSIALQICGVYSSFAEVDDIVNEGLIMLMSAVDKFDPGRGVKFKTYVSKRIHGMIIDLARQQDWLPRSVRRRSREIDQAVGELCSTLGRFPTDQELADKMGVALEKYREDLANSALYNVVSLEAIFERRGEGDTGIFIPSRDTAVQPEASLQRKEMREQLVAAVGMLRKNEQTVLSLYYEKGFNMRNIAQVMNVSEPRVSQIHSRAIQKLRVYMESYLSGQGVRRKKGE
ncbi:MAG: FliA/WhiG family RNA polymerase sigma factor [Intestinimonas sp.]|nr:FliA/WhiG family RNA polymerase sigma factor [Intestinimonas sp.]